MTIRSLATGLVLLALNVAPLAAGSTATGKRLKVAESLNIDGFNVKVPKYLAEIFEEAGARYDVDPNLVAAMAFRESRFQPTAVSSRGATGIMQLMPKTARSLGVTDASDPKQSIFGGAKYLRMMLDMFDGDVELSLAAYNAGPGAVKKRGKGATAEAVAYVAAVQQFYASAR